MTFVLKGHTDLQRELAEEFGSYVPLRRVWRQLSYPSAEAARKAASHGLLPILCFQLPGRRGWFLRSFDVTEWISAAYHSVPASSEMKSPPSI
jgi:hypothetical protein